MLLLLAVSLLVCLVCVCPCLYLFQKDKEFLPENLQGGVALNTLLLAKIGLDSAVNLGNWDAVLLELGGSNLVLGGYRCSYQVGNVLISMRYHDNQASFRVRHQLCAF